MAALTLNSIRLSTLALAVALALAPPALAGDVSVKLDAGTGFSVKNSTGATERLRVDEATGNISRNGALFVHTTGTNNTFVGAGAGNTATTGPAATPPSGMALSSPTPRASRTPPSGMTPSSTTPRAPTTLRSANAGQNLTSGSDNLYLSNTGVAVESGRIRIGTDLTHTATYIAGIEGVDVGAGALPVFVNANGQLGTTGGSQTSWTGAIDAASYGVSDLGSSMFVDLTQNVSSAYLGADQAGKGWGWKPAERVEPIHHASGLDTAYVASFNSDAAGGGINQDYLHSIVIGNEAAWVPIGVTGSNSAPGPQAEFHTDFYTKTSTWEIGSLSGIISDAEVFAIRRDGGDGHVVAVGRSRGYSAPVLSIDWYPITADSDPPAAEIASSRPARRRSPV